MGLSAITGTTILSPSRADKSLHLIWRSGIRKSSNDLQRLHYMRGYQDISSNYDCRVTSLMISGKYGFGNGLSPIQGLPLYEPIITSISKSSIWCQIEPVVPGDIIGTAKQVPGHSFKSQQFTWRWDNRRVQLRAQMNHRDLKDSTRIMVPAMATSRHTLYELHVWTRREFLEFSFLLLRLFSSCFKHNSM